jgi:peptidoglycan L-alanyl-D-glutamate endopeptidase CwlK
MSRINTLHPLIREEVRQAVDHVNTHILTSRVKMLVIQGLRTFEEQDKLFYKRPKVTNAKGGQSIHNYGLAFDFCLFQDGKLVWDVMKDFDGDGHPDWMEVVAYFKSLGYVWGGDFKSFKDRPHFEKTFGHTWRQLLALKELGKVDAQGYITIKL